MSNLGSSCSVASLPLGNNSALHNAIAEPHRVFNELAWIQVGCVLGLPTRKSVFPTKPAGRTNKNGASRSLRHSKFTLYFQNSKLTPGKWTFPQIYISTRMCGLAEMRRQKGLDKNLRPMPLPGRRGTFRSGLSILRLGMIRVQLCDFFLQPAESPHQRDEVGSVNDPGRNICGKKKLD